MRFINKTALVTGAASGMGFLTAKCMAEEGACVVLADINQEGLDKAAAEIGKTVPAERILTYAGDVRDYAQVVATKDAAIEKFGRIDILVCCAGGAETRLLGQHGRFHELPIDVFDFGIDLNLKGPAYFSHAVLPQMQKQKSGVIILMGSITGVEGSEGSVAYAAAKSALMNGVVKSLALLGAPHNIRACCVAPGPVLTRAAMANMKTLLGRASEPQEIVDMILFLCADSGASVTGTTFLMDGGRNVMINKE